MASGEELTSIVTELPSVRTMRALHRLSVRNEYRRAFLSSNTGTVISVRLLYDGVGSSGNVSYIIFQLEQCEAEHTFDEKDQTEDIFTVPEFAFKCDAQVKWLSSSNDELWVNGSFAEKVLVRSVTTTVPFDQVVNTAYYEITWVCEEMYYNSKNRQLK